MKLYLSGPMTGFPQFNVPAFEKAAVVLRSMGYEIVSPVEMDGADGIAEAVNASPDGNVADLVKKTGVTYGDMLARDVKVICDHKIEGIVVLPMWAQSRGAKFEVFAGLLSNCRVFRYRGPTHPLVIEEISKKAVLTSICYSLGVELQ